MSAAAELRKLRMTVVAIALVIALVATVVFAVPAVVQNNANQQRYHDCIAAQDLACMQEFNR